MGDLLIALRRAGAVRISAPVCAGCDKPLRTLQRRGQDWLCAVCGPRREPCAGCGQTRPVTFRDREGQPRCGRCPPEDARDLVEVVVEVVAGLDPTVPAETVRAAVREAVPSPGSATGWPGPWPNGPNCSPAPELRPPSPRCSG